MEQIESIDSHEDAHPAALHQVGDRVQVVSGKYAGRAGVVSRIPKVIPDWVYVTLDLKKRERVIKTKLIAVTDLDLVETDPVFGVDLRRDLSPIHPYEHYKLMTLELDIAKAWKLVNRWDPFKRLSHLREVPLPLNSLALHIIDTKRAQTADLTVPLLVGQFETFQPLVIDGWHRIYRAHKEGRKSLPGFALTRIDTASVRLDKGPK